MREAAERANRAMEAQRTPPAEGQPGEQPAEQGIQTLTPQDQQPDPNPRNVQQDPPREEPQTDDIEHKYRSLKGRFDAELAKRDAQIEGFRELLANLQRTPPQQERPKEAPVETFTAGPDAELSEDERRDYGPDLISVIEKVAKRVAYDVAGKVRSEVQKIEQRVGTVQQSADQTAQERFLSGLSAAVEDWQTLNEDAEFLKWLAVPDPFSGNTRQQMLNEAVQQKNATRVAAFFQGYKRELQAVSPQSPQPAASRPAMRQGNGRVPLADLAAPGRAKPGASGAPQEKPTWTRQGISEFYDDVRKGKFRGREAEQQRLEADLIAATTEGRLMQ